MHFSAVPRTPGPRTSVRSEEAVTLASLQYWLCARVIFLARSPDLYGLSSVKPPGTV
jgi:hypothetical protein